MDDTEDDTAATLNSISSSTDSGDRSLSAEIQAGTSLEQKMEYSKVNNLHFAALQTQNQTGLKVSLRIIISELKVFERSHSFNDTMDQPSLKQFKS